jgi:hypothetical protein
LGAAGWAAAGPGETSAKSVTPPSMSLIRADVICIFPPFTIWIGVAEQMQFVLRRRKMRTRAPGDH